MDTKRALNATAGTLLGFLHEKPMTGFELAAKSQTITGEFWNVTRSQVYRELKDLSSRGLVTMHELGPRERRPFAITALGRTAFASWIDEPPGELTMRFPIVLAVFFGRHLPPGHLAGFLATHRAHHVRRVAECKALEPEVSAMPDAHAALRLGIAFHTAVVGWIDGIDVSSLPSTPETKATKPPSGRPKPAGRKARDKRA